MDSSCRCKIFLLFRIFVWFLILLLSVSSVQSLEKNKINQMSQTSEAAQENLKTMRDYLMKINKPGIKTINSPDGDIIDCVLFHQQPAFDHPELKKKKLLDPPEIPKGYNSSRETNEYFQLWSMSGESCPDGTVPIRRVTEEDVLQFGNISTFGRKTIRSSFTNDNHEHAIAFIKDTKFYGGGASINVWAPSVKGESEFSLAQIWIISDTEENRNTIEAGWQVYPRMYHGDWQPRFFIYWTRDSYKTTGCYNFLCPGFVQIDDKIAPGAALAPTSAYGGRNYEIILKIFKDSNTGNWWLQYGESLVGYWPSVLFTSMQDYATEVHFGGEITNLRGVDGTHTSTQMGSGHFSEEGDGKAAYFNNIKVAKEPNSFTHDNLKVAVTHPNCYNIKGVFNENYGYYFYYGGPGRNPKCP